jgi:hypothetical protein
MKVLMHLAFSCAFLFADCAVCWGQNGANLVDATLCDLYQHPDQYAGKMVKVRGTVAGNDLWIDAFTEKPCPTYMRIIVVFPAQLKTSPGFDLVRDQSFKEFENAVYHPRPIGIEATFEGRFDAAFYWRDHKRIPVGQGELKGYGKKHDYDGQIVLLRVLDVVTKPVPRL